MGIPKKPRPSMLASFSKSFWEYQSQPRQFLRIRDLPKLKLLRWTAYFFVSSVSLFMFFGGPRQLYNQERYELYRFTQTEIFVLQQAFYHYVLSRLMSDARALEKAYLNRPDDKGRIGSSQAFSNNYGFDYAKEKERPSGDVTGE